MFSKLPKVRHALNRMEYATIVHYQRLGRRYWTDATKLREEYIKRQEATAPEWELELIVDQFNEATAQSAKAYLTARKLYLGV